MKLKDRSAIILSGGESKRFEGDSTDKALQKLDGKTLLNRVINSVRGITGEVILSVKAEPRKRKYREALKEESISDIRIVTDENALCRGPLRGIMTCLKHVSKEQTLTIPCDVPLMKPDLLDHLFNSLEDCDVAVPTWGNGNLEALIGAYSSEKMTKIAKALCLLGRQRPDDLFRSAPEVKFVSVEKDLKPLDPELESFVNINHPRDLEELPRREKREDIFTETRVFKSDTNMETIEDLLDKSNNLDQDTSEYILENLNKENSTFWKASALKRKAEVESEESKSKSQKINREFIKAGELFEREAKVHLKRNILFLAGHSLFDAEKCWREAGNKEKAQKIRERAENMFERMDHEKNVSEDSHSDNN